MVIAGCGDDDEPASPAASSSGVPVAVVATTTQTGDFASVVGGDLVDVYKVINPNVVAHDYEATPADIERLGDAAVIVQNGAGLEEWIEDTIAQSDTSAVIVDASSGVTLRAGGEEEPAEGHDNDPHIWMSPVNAKTMVCPISPPVSCRPTCPPGDLRNQPGRLPGADRRARRRRPGPARHVDRQEARHQPDALGYYIDYYGLQFVGP